MNVIFSEFLRNGGNRAWMYWAGEMMKECDVIRQWRHLYRAGLFIYLGLADLITILTDILDLSTPSLFRTDLLHFRWISWHFRWTYDSSNIKSWHILWKIFPHYTRLCGRGNMLWIDLCMSLFYEISTIGVTRWLIHLL